MDKSSGSSGPSLGSFSTAAAAADENAKWECTCDLLASTVVAPVAQLAAALCRLKLSAAAAVAAEIDGPFFFFLLFFFSSFSSFQQPASQRFCVCAGAIQQTQCRQCNTLIHHYYIGDRDNSVAAAEAAERRRQKVTHAARVHRIQNTEYRHCHREGEKPDTLAFSLSLFFIQTTSQVVGCRGNEKKNCDTTRRHSLRGERREVQQFKLRWRNYYHHEFFQRNSFKKKKREQAILIWQKVYGCKVKDANTSSVLLFNTPLFYS